MPEPVLKLAPSLKPPKPRAATLTDALRKRMRFILLVVVPVIAVVTGLVFYMMGGRYVSTDDAYVHAAKLMVSTDISGLVSEVDVREGQAVKAGDVLFRVDPRQFQIALENTKASLAQTALSLQAMKQDYTRMQQDIAAQQSQVDMDQNTFDRDTALIKTNAVAQSTYDQAHFALEGDKSKLESLRTLSQVQLARLGGNPDFDVTQHPQYLQVKAQVDEAQRQLDHTVVNAPFAGIVTNVPSIAPGKYLQASMTAFYLVAADHVWVVANPKETELTYVRTGQSASVTVDTYPDMQWSGSVESISPAAAQEFSLLPAQNTSGNWVKVVQRIPVRVRIDTNDKGLPPVRPGMSVEVDVDTGHSRGLPRFLTAMFGHDRQGR